VKLDEVIRRLKAAGLNVASSDRLPDNYGNQVRCHTGEIVSVYDTGRIVVGGKNKGRTEELLGVPATPQPTGPEAEAREGASTNRTVFVVYGHDTKAKTELEAMLRRWDIDPLILDQLPSEGQTLIEKLEKYTSAQEVRFAVVLATPDDEGFAKGKEDERKFRARQNVVLELGLLLAKLGRPRVAILLKEQAKMEPPSDIHGLIYIPFVDSVEDAKVTLAKEMAKQGLPVVVGKL
jgi:predicted nucleotide-binding protein